MENEPADETANETADETGNEIGLEVRRNGVLSAVVAGLSALVATAYFARAAGTGNVVDWLVCAALAGLAIAHALAFLDARSPLLVADDHGVRIRLGRIWRGIPWSGLEAVEVLARHGFWRDGRVVLLPRGDEEQLGVRLGLATKVWGADAGLTESLAALADSATDVREASRKPPVRDEPDELEGRKPDVVPDPQQAVKPGRVPVSVGVPVLTRSDSARELTVVIEDLASVPAVEPVIGPELVTARRRLGLTVDQVAERTRIRPHVIEAIEIDDFAPCGGDFYARGHLRTLARVLGVDAAPLLETYDTKYADAPLDPRCVFEAELATAGQGPIRGVRGGPNWSLLVASVMTVVLIWSVARLVMDHPVAVTPAPPSLADGSAGLTSGGRLAPAVPVVLTAAGGGARVVLRDGGGKVVFTGPLAFGQSQTFSVSPPVRVQSTDGSLEVTVDGERQGALGKTGEPAQDVFTDR